MALRLYRMGAIYYKICIDSYEIYLLECFTSPLSISSECSFSCSCEKSYLSKRDVRRWTVGGLPASSARQIVIDRDRQNQTATARYLRTCKGYSSPREREREQRCHVTTVHVPNHRRRPSPPCASYVRCARPDVVGWVCRQHPGYEGFRPLGENWVCRSWGVN